MKTVYSLLFFWSSNFRFIHLADCKKCADERKMYVNNVASITIGLDADHIISKMLPNLTFKNSNYVPRNWKLDVMRLVDALAKFTLDVLYDYLINQAHNRCA